MLFQCSLKYEGYEGKTETLLVLTSNTIFLTYWNDIHRIKLLDFLLPLYWIHSRARMNNLLLCYSVTRNDVHRASTKKLGTNVHRKNYCLSLFSILHWANNYNQGEKWYLRIIQCWMVEATFCSKWSVLNFEKENT